MLGFGVYFLLYALRAMGAGDVNSWPRWERLSGRADWFAIFIATAIAGGVLAVVLMVHSGRVFQTLQNTFFIVGELVHLRAPFTRRKDLDVKNPNALRMPHGVAIAAGTVACLLLGII